MDLLTAALVGIPSAAAIVCALYARATHRRIAASLDRVVQIPPKLIFATCGAADMGRDTPSCDFSVLPSEPERVTDMAMKSRARCIIDGRWTDVGAEAPATTAEDRERLAWQFRAARSPSALAAALGIKLLAADLDDEPQSIRGTTLAYRDDDDAATWILYGLAGEVLRLAGTSSTESDVWLLAARLAGASALFERAPRSRGASA